MTTEKEIRKKLKRKPVVQLPGLSSGSTLLNLACTGNARTAFFPGRFYLFVGDSSSGKSFLTLTSFAEASINPDFDSYRLIYDNAENGALMDMEKYFGKAVASRLEAPSMLDGMPKYSETVEEFYDTISHLADEGRPFFYVLDSMDALETDDDRSKFREGRKARESGKQISGSYGTAKAKANSIGLRMLNNTLIRTNSICIIISQTRENIGFDAAFNPKTRGGGKSLRFYAAVELWSSIKGKIKQTIGTKTVQTGIVAQVKVKKNRQSGREPTVDVPILNKVGVDDLLSCINYLVDWGHWKGTEKKVEAPEFSFSGSKEGLIQRILEKSQEADLIDIVQEVWDEIEKRLTPNRKSRYS